MYINNHSYEENSGADNQCRRVEIGDRIVMIRSEIEEPTALHKGITGVEYKADGDNGDRHFTVTFHQRWKNERAFNIVCLKEDEDDECYKVKWFNTKRQRYNIERGHGNEHRRFHNEPSDFALHRHPPAVVERHAIRRCNKLKYKENDEC